MIHFCVVPGRTRTNKHYTNICIGAFLKALRIRLNLDEDLAVGCNVSTMSNGVLQHSPYRLHLHISIEALENGHDVAEEIIKSIKTCRDLDIGRDGYQTTTKSKTTKPMQSSAEKSTSNEATSKEITSSGSNEQPSTEPSTAMNLYDQSFLAVFKNQLCKTNLIPPPDLQLLSMSAPHKAFEDAAIFGALDPDADVSLGLWNHVPGSTISNHLFPKYTDPQGNEFFLYTKKRFHDLTCPHATSMEPLSDAISMEENVLLLDLVVTSEFSPLPEKTTEKVHVVVVGDQHEVPQPPTHSLCIPCPQDRNLRGTLPMEDERLVLIVSIAHR